MLPLTKLHSQNGAEAQIGAGTLTGKYFAIMKGSGAVITSALDQNGVALDSDVITFINSDYPEGVYYYQPLSEIVVSTGNLLALND